jgi:hypothetical protein
LPGSKEDAWEVIPPGVSMIFDNLGWKHALIDYVEEAWEVFRRGDLKERLRDAEMFSSDQHSACLVL